MDICRRIDIEVAATFRAGLPPGWRDHPVLGRFTDPHQLIREVRHATFESDGVGLALLALGVPESQLLLMAAAVPFALKECGGVVRERIDDMHDEWQAGDRRYLSDTSMAELYPTRDNDPVAELEPGD